MTNLALAPAGAAAPAHGTTTAAELAARIPLPRQLGLRGLRPRARYLPHEPTSTGAVMPNSFADRYRAAMRETGCCPIEAGLLGRLADNECAHGRLPGDRTAKCGCWPQENAPIIAITRRPRPPKAARKAA